MDLNQRPRWACSWRGENGEQCTKWAQKRRLCRQHFCQYKQQQTLRAATELAGIINNDGAAPVCNIADNIEDHEQLNDAAPVENAGNQANNNDPHDMVDEQSNDTAAPVHNTADSMDNNEQLNDAAPVENISNHAIINDCCEVADGQLIEAVVVNGNIETHFAAIHNDEIH